MSDGKRKGIEGNVTNDSNPDIFSRFTNYLDDHVREIGYARYALVGAGAILIIRSTYMMSKFRHVSDIPAKYIENRVKLRGHVSQVADNGTLLVEHIPLIDTTWMRRRKGLEEKLAIELAAIELEENGHLWLQNTMPGKAIWFTTLLRNDKLICIVSARMGFLRSCCVNEELVRSGMAKVKHIDGLAHDDLYITFSEKLLRHEMYAERKGKGIWKLPPVSEQVRTYFREMWINVTSPVYRIVKWFGKSKSNTNK